VDHDGTVVRKLGHKVRLSAGPREVACTSMYLDDGDLPPVEVPAWLSVVREVTDDEGWTGASLAS
jgi:hypothetical protein